MINKITNKLQIKAITNIFAKFVIVENSHNFDQENTSWK